MTFKVDDHALILIAVMPTRRDFEIARLLGWYRIPLRMAPKIVDVDMLAFYQTAAFGENHRWLIESVAPVKGVELTTRAELLRDEPDHPRAREEYYKISLGPIQALDKPIPSGKWKRVTFLYSLGELFNKAETINDLVVRNEERELLWRSLRERKLQPGEYAAGTNPDADIDPQLLVEIFAGLNSSDAFDSFTDL